MKKNNCFDFYIVDIGVVIATKLIFLPILLTAIVMDTGEFPFYQNRSRKVIPPIAAR